MLPYFLKSEDAHLERKDEEFHNEGGYFSVSDSPYRTEAAKAYVKAAQEAGYPYVDYNGKNQMGVSYIQSTTREGKKCTAENAFLRPVRNRSNLKIQTRSRVSRVLVDEESKTAYGVEYLKNGEVHYAFANKEVILSAGGLHSPQILMLSGIGPKQHLEQFGGLEVLTYIRTNISSEPDPSYPDVELFIASEKFAFIIQVFPMLVHPKSKGHMELKSTDPLDSPKFFANYLSDPENHDVKTFIAAIREIQRINDSPSMQRYGAKLVDTKIPGCEDYQFDSDEYWECYLRTIIASVYHYVGACKMGPENKGDAVVDSYLRVHGLKQLRVVDTSVIPLPLTAHAAAPIYAIAEKAADVIKNDWFQ
nr:glucose dehydrogenase [FAD, quinone]-like [Leptinotarsa decemlineata]